MFLLQSLTLSVTYFPLLLLSFSMVTREISEDYPVNDDDFLTNNNTGSRKDFIVVSHVKEFKEKQILQLQGSKPSSLFSYEIYRNIYIFS